MKITARILAAMAFAGSLASPVIARDVVWTLSDVTFDDGGTASGWLEYDADADTIDGWAITTTGGTIMDGFDYQTNIYAFVEGVGDLILGGNSQYDPYLRLHAFGPLSDAGGTVALLTGLDGSYECDNCDTVRAITGGALVAPASPVPEPAVWTTMVAGFGAIGLVARRRRSARTGFAF
jgi:hypothetical protein